MNLRRRGFLLGSLVSLLGIAPLAAFTASEPPESSSSAPTALTHRLLVLGDSLSAGYGLRAGQSWVDLLAIRLQGCVPPWEVINASVSGETTAGGRLRLPTLLARHRPGAVLIALGANDGLRGLSLAQMEQNLTAMLQSVHATGVKVILAGMRIPPNFGPDYAEAFFQVFVRVAREQAVAGFYPFLLEPIALDESAFQEDRLHPTAAAQPRILAGIHPLIARVLDCRQ